MKIIVLGADGYIGFPLTLHLLNLGHDVWTLDNGVRRSRVNTIGSESLTPILSRIKRRSFLQHKYINYRGQYSFNLGTNNPGYLRSYLNEVKPDTIVHLAEQSSAPWSMIDPYKASVTQQENVIGTLHLLWAMKEECPDAHLVKLGTMGEYGTPNCDIPEGRIPERCLLGRIPFEINTRLNRFAYSSPTCPMRGLLFPHTAGSFYHLSKVHDTYNIEFACRNWGLRSTDIMQGVVFGLMSDDLNEITRFDYDEYFGTVINRFCAQALIEHPLTVYGKGNQQRGFLPLKDSIQCLTLTLNNPPEQGEYRTFNQFENIYPINKLADTICRAAKVHGIQLGIKHIPNPRKESEEHYYNPVREKLTKLGYEPTTNIEGEITKLIGQLLPFKDEVKEEVILPKTKW